jgi:hypothetical protein
MTSGHECEPIYSGISYVEEQRKGYLSVELAGLPTQKCWAITDTIACYISKAGMSVNFFDDHLSR